MKSDPALSKSWNSLKQLGGLRKTDHGYVTTLYERRHDCIDFR